MISLPEFKQLLGHFAENLTDAEIDRIRIAEYHIADAIFEQWLRSRKAVSTETSVAAKRAKPFIKTLIVSF